MSFAPAEIWPFTSSPYKRAQAIYEHHKRALELGALPPLDIYRSESEVALRRVQVIQAEYALNQAEDALRLTIGPDQDTYVEALDLDLTQSPEPQGELKAIDISIPHSRRRWRSGRKSKLRNPTRVAQAKANLLQAQVNYQNAIAALDYATGDMLEA